MSAEGRVPVAAVGNILHRAEMIRVRQFAPGLMGFGEGRAGGSFHGPIFGPVSLFWPSARVAIREGGPMLEGPIEGHTLEWDAVEIDDGGAAMRSERNAREGVKGNRFRVPETAL
jgi:hypothetical protein